ncbi:bifunctional proline dehydrogenase/L-glutamate gamma-semialdehyde dehydrogenase PutA [Rhodobacteraceae bacterium KN286]|uniref:Bifunctional protein PutA n=2 Tax=Oceanomicrobium pacificus TaxID=2692916 RepID=A0A6B0TUZ6_9RHOB|nr:bifunctional proline dehydrogenase/L-glutamate gamma-semialdehyde dehydrogenase PutA [Oceanomicrobium pacificus]
MIRSATLAPEAECLSVLVDLAALSPEDRRRISGRGAALVRAVRDHSEPAVMESFLAEYGLSSEEGVALMCLAEALLRVPDAETIDDLIEDKIAPHDWAAHVGDSGSILVNASTWALMLTGRVLEDEEPGVVGALRGVVRRLGEPVIRVAVRKAMREMGDQFVLGETMDAAIARGAGDRAKGITFSYDMLGEAARTHADAERYFNAYADAIARLAKAPSAPDLRDAPGISVKLSALHPRYEYGQKAHVVPALGARLLDLCRAAKDAGIGLNVDAEEADRLDLSLDILDHALSSPDLAGWDGFGVVVQAYGRRAPHVLDWLHALAERHDRRIMVRLVKGAYWDTEIKRAQVLGLDSYPVFTRKVATDVSYIACARKLLGMRDRIYGQFATHNAHTMAAILHMAGEDRDGFEFQRLHGMGGALHDIVRRDFGTRCRVYAPVGAHRDLLAYLVRRLLENGANSSFVHQIVDENVAPEEIASDPFTALEVAEPVANPAIPAPPAIFSPVRENARGWDLTDPDTVDRITGSAFMGDHRWEMAPEGLSGPVQTLTNPARPGDSPGSIRQAARSDVAPAVARAAAAAQAWAATPVAERAACLSRAAALFEAHALELFALAAREAGKTLPDCVAELREAIDFLHYYAAEAEEACAGSEARGPLVCISPWNFPLAIFTGQVAAALVTGNTVLAKPAEQTPLIAARATALLHEAGIPRDVLQLLPGDGPEVGAALTADPRIKGVCFTGSTEVARLIERSLAAHAAPDAMLIAETGGLNAMIVDSTALLEQAVRDTLASAFQSAGQRCSALRIVYVQEDIRAPFIEMLTGAMDALRLGDPRDPATDVGPLIDAEAQADFAAYVASAAADGRLIHRTDAPSEGHFLAPTLLAVDGIGAMEREIFGPVLHLAGFRADRINAVMAEVNARGYGLTFGLHTRIDRRAQDVVDRMEIGNLYINRNQIGAIVAAQPFGGEGLSGTGPKAGGPHYLPRFRKRAGAGPAPAGQGPAQSDAGADTDLLAALDRLSARPMPPGDPLGALRAALRGRGRAALAKAAQVDMGPVDLPGPTGEANSLSLHPLGTVAILGPTAADFLTQAIHALRCGNRVLAVGAQAGALSHLSRAGLPLEIVPADATSDALAHVPVAAFAIDPAAPLLAPLRRALAAEDGPIRRIISDADRPAAFALERAVCVDTTAAGGNAALLAETGGD